MTPKSLLVSLLVKTGQGNSERNIGELCSWVHREGWVPQQVLYWWLNGILKTKRPFQRALCHPQWWAWTYSRCCCSSQPFPPSLLHVNMFQSIWDMCNRAAAFSSPDSDDDRFHSSVASMGVGTHLHFQQVLEICMRNVPWEEFRIHVFVYTDWNYEWVIISKIWILF